MEVHFSPDVQSKLSRLAAQQGRNSEMLVVEAVERMMDYDEWFLAEVQKGLRQIELGQTVSHEDVGERLDAYLSGKRQPA